MTLPAPILDDRRFQDIVDEAKRLIPKYCPDWTDHNVADPGVALIELFAWMSEMILYRVNQVPDLLYIKFLDLIGIELFPAAAASADILFELAAPATEPLTVPAGTQVATAESIDTPVVFMTDRDLVITAPRLSACLTRSAAGVFNDHWDAVRTRSRKLKTFSTMQPGDAVYLGFAESLAGNLIQVDVETSAEGAGIRPEDPPREWQAWNGVDWQPLLVLKDTSGGFNTTGSVHLLLPARHEPMPLGSTRAYWLRCRLMPLHEGQKPYDVSPQLDAISVLGLGGSAQAHHGEPAPAELLGVSSGDPGQVFTVRRAPVLPRRASEHVRVLVPAPVLFGLDGGTPLEDRWEDWTEVADFTDTDPDDRVYIWSAATGEIRFPPHIRQPRAVRDVDDRVDPDGVRRYGAVPVSGAQVWVTGYRYGGGRHGNVGARKLTSLRTTLPGVATVYNLAPATGGVDVETVENAKLRGPMQLRGGSRAVTAADFERITVEAARGVARARCLPPTGPDQPVRVLVVPRVEVDPELLELPDLKLPEELHRSIADHLEERRLLTVQVVVEPPDYLGICVAARVRAAPMMRPETVRAACESALYRHINPVVGGPAGEGWPFRRDLNIGEVFGVLSGLEGVLGVEEVVLYGADLRKPPRSRRVRDDRLGNVVQLADGALFASCDHRVVVVQ
jgi:predicted phage baseplate assembly protein